MNIIYQPGNMVRSLCLISHSEGDSTFFTSYRMVDARDMAAMGFLFYPVPLKTNIFL